MSHSPRPLSPLSSLIFASRWLQLPLYLGLILAQCVYVFLFGKELWHLLSHSVSMGEHVQRFCVSAPNPRQLREIMPVIRLPLGHVKPARSSSRLSVTNAVKRKRHPERHFSPHCVGRVELCDARRLVPPRW